MIAILGNFSRDIKMEKVKDISLQAISIREHERMTKFKDLEQ
jgi:hypothetical protein